MEKLSEKNLSMDEINLCMMISSVNRMKERKL